MRYLDFRSTAFSLIGSAMIGVVSTYALAATVPPRYKADTPTTFHRLDQIYYIQPHNSFDHGSSLTGWLDRGFRAVELDVIDRGDWEYHAYGPYVSHSFFGEPGNKNCSNSGDTRLGHCLQDIMNWIDAHPNNTTPILVFIDMKSIFWSYSNDWYPEEVAELDEWIKNFVGWKLYKFSDLYSYVFGKGGGSYPRELLAQHGWPTLSALQGKMIVVLTGGRYNQVNQHMGGALYDLYINYNRYPATVMCPDVESDPEELDINGTIDGINSTNSKFFVCSNLRSRDHYQITANRAARNKQLIHLNGGHVYGNTSFTYNYIAVAHGVSAIGQDLNDYNNATTHGGSIPYVGVRRSLPGYFKLKPTGNTSMCMDVSGSRYRNGSKLNSWPCHSGDNQRFVFTAEGQLRPKGNNKYCVDIKGGDAGNGKDIHLWDCDGGNSEKWYIDPNGNFKSYDNSRYCLDSDLGRGTDWEHQRHNDNC